MGAASVASKLPIMQSDSEQLTLMQTRWAELLNPLIANPITAGAVLKQVELISGSNTINHRLGRKLQGWFIVRQRAAAQIYDTQDSNSMPQLTLTLTSSAPVSCDIWVY